MSKSIQLSENIYFLLHRSEYKIYNEIESILKSKLKSEKEVDKHLKRHYLKYLWVIDEILSKNLKYNKKSSSCQIIEYNKLYQLTNKVNIELNEGKQTTLAKLILDTLQEAKLIKKITNPNYYFGIASEYKVISIEKNRLDSIPFNCIHHSKNQIKFIDKIEATKKKNLEIDTPVKIKMYEWMNKLDFSHINRSNLSQNHKLYIEYFEKYKFQIQGSTGRIYNSFTNMPKILRNDLRVNGEKLGQLDLANAQSIFLSWMVLEYLNESGQSIDQQTWDFITWSELGKSFEFVNNKEKFHSGQNRNSFKTMFWKCIMDKNENMSNYRVVYENIKNSIPQILDVIEKIKSKDHTVMAKILQKKESEMMISIFEKIMVDRDCSLLHDAIYYPNKDYKDVRNDFIEQARMKGLKFTLKQEFRFINENFPWSDSFLSFEPELNHWKVIKKYQSLFENYPSEILKKAKEMKLN
jgi:hypothetical protein